MARFERIARDLEKLPCELHDGVLVDLEFAQLIHLSACAGPRVTWSLQNSLSPWGPLFREDKQLRALMEVTKLVQKFCFTNPKTKEWRTWPNSISFRYASTLGKLAFLSYQGTDWRSSKADEFRTHGVVDPAILTRYWLTTLNEIVSEITWDAMHMDFPQLIGPWKDNISGAQDVFAEIPDVGLTAPGVEWNHLRAQPKRSAMSTERLAQFIDVYQRVRVTRAEAFAKELYLLADLYEAHPTRLKMPFAPQTVRLNKQHIPSAMRREASLIVKRANTTWWKYKEIYSYRFRYPFPALIMYEWTLQLFRKVMEKHVCLNSEYLEIIVEKTRPILDGLPRWAPSFLILLGHDQSAGISDAISHLELKREHHTTRVKYRSRSEGELKWLASFAEVVAWMEGEFPEIVEEVRGHDWEEPNEVDATK